VCTRSPTPAEPFVADGLDHPAVTMQARGPGFDDGRVGRPPIAALRVDPRREQDGDGDVPKTPSRLASS
jgi:hypothetical protein